MLSLSRTESHLISHLLRTKNNILSVAKFNFALKIGKQRMSKLNKYLIAFPVDYQQLKTDLILAPCPQRAFESTLLAKFHSEPLH